MIFIKVFDHFGSTICSGFNWLSGLKLFKMEVAAFQSERAGGSRQSIRWFFNCIIAVRSQPSYTGLSCLLTVHCSVWDSNIMCKINLQRSKVFHSEERICSTAIIWHRIILHPSYHQVHEHIVSIWTQCDIQYNFLKLFSY